ncbi:MAG: MTAP family purine nucleoside phosphorylase [Chloroflexi bacterium]|nr:MAG: MTAP family purine nucleoside phosphorylase [Chloroflexota bacterium]
MAGIPKCAHAIVGGAGTAALDFPGELGDARVSAIDGSIVASTPFGESPAVQHIRVEGADGRVREALVARMHGWRQDPRRRQAVLALFWVFREAGVRRVLAEAGAASISQNFRPRDLVLPHDVMDFSPPASGLLEPGYMAMMRAPFCPELREALWTQAGRWATDKATRAFNRAVHGVGQGARFETAAEVAAYARLGVDVLSQAISPEVYLAREIGACYAALLILLNYAEGVRPSWDYELLQEILHDDARSLGALLVDALLAVPEQAACACLSYRKQLSPGDVTGA